MKTFYDLLKVIAVILVIVGLWFVFDSKSIEINIEPDQKSDQMTSDDLMIGSVVSKNTDRGRIYSLFGTSSSSPLTFASTTATATSTESPHTSAYTTSSVPFYVGLANLLTFSGNHYASNTDSEITITIAGSNDNACENPVESVNRANWSPIAQPTTTSTPQSVLRTALETITLSASAVGDNIFSFTIEEPNFNCVRLIASTNSTTDDSQLYMEVSIQDK